MDISAISNSSDRQRDRSRRGDRGSRFTDADADDKNRSRSRDNLNDGNCKRVYVSNIPYTFRWQDLKDLFRRLVGTVEFAEIFNDENNKSRGCGIVEFRDPGDAGKAVETMNRHDINGRELVVKLDQGDERDKHGRVVRGSWGGGNVSGGNVGGGQGERGRNAEPRDIRDEMRFSSGGGGGGNGGGGNNGGGNFNNFSQNEQNYNTFGLSTSFLENLGIQAPLHTKIFVANLDYKVDEAKLRQVFKLAGRVVEVDLSLDKDGKSRGFAVIEYDHPVESVQAISMFDQQLLFERRMKIRLDRIPDNEKLPEGLGGIGMGLGPNGEPLKNVAINLPSLQNQNNSNNNSNLSNIPGPVSAPLGASNLLGSVPNSRLNSDVAALNNFVGNLNNLNPLLTTLGLGNLASAGVNNADSLSSSLDLGSKSFIGSGAGNNVGSLVGNSQFNSLSQSSRLDTSLSNQYSSGLGNSSSGGGGGGNTGSYSSNQRGLSDFDLGSLRGYNTQSDDFGRSSGLGSYSSAQQQLQLQNIIKNGSVGGGGGGNNSGSNRNVSDTILIRNLPPSCTWQTLRDIFRDIGEVKFAEIRGQDSGVVRFSKERDAELAIKLKDGSRYDGRTIQIGFF